MSGEPRATPRRPSWPSLRCGEGRATGLLAHGPVRPIMDRAVQSCKGRAFGHVEELIGRYVQQLLVSPGGPVNNQAGDGRGAPQAEVDRSVVPGSEPPRAAKHLANLGARCGRNRDSGTAAIRI